MFASLSPRQGDVLEGVLGGKLNKIIAHELGLSVRTVEGYRAEIMARTQAKSLPELVRMSVLAGL
jgi:two-component system response regulator FixJ